MTAPAFDTPPAEITLWESINKTQGKRRALDWHTFFARSEWHEPAVLTDKMLGRGWSPATFQGDLRSKDNVEQVCALVLDYEAPEGIDPATIEEALALWQGAWGVLHTSYRHTAERPRFRVILPLSRPVTPEEYALLWAWAAQKCAEAGHPIDQVCRDACRFWFLPQMPPDASAPYVLATIEGSGLFDVDLALHQQRERERPPTPQPRPRVTPTPAASSPATTGPERYVRKALEGALDDVRQAPKGTRHNVIRTKAWHLGGMLHTGVLGAHEVEQALMSEAERCGWTELDKTRRTVRYQIAEGAKRPKLIPERPDLRVVAGGYTHEQAANGEPTDATAETQDGPAPLPLGIKSVGVWQGEQAPVPFVSKRIHLAPGRPVGLIGYAGSGKTLLAGDILLAVAGAPGDTFWGGLTVDRHGPALLIDLEVGEYLTRQRLTRLAAARGRPLESYAPHLFWTSFPKLSLLDPAAEKLLAESLKDFALCVIDSLAKLLSGFDENSSSVSHVMGVLARVSEATGCAIVILHHEGKPPQDGSQREARFRGRGSSAIQGEWSSQWVVDARGEGQLVIEHGKSQWGRLQESHACRILDIGDPSPETGMSPAVALSGLSQEGAPVTVEAVEESGVERCKRTILEALETFGPKSTSDLLAKVRGNQTVKWRALAELKRDARVIEQRVWRTNWVRLPSHPPVEDARQGGRGSTTTSGRESASGEREDER